MKALTILQPWASAIALGHKRIETRSWNTDYRGPLLIHAGKSGVYVPRRFDEPETEQQSIGDEVLRLCDIFKHRPEMPFGAIIAVCELTTCFYFDVPLKATTRFRPYDEGAKGSWPGGMLYEVSEWPQVGETEYALGDFTPGRYGWVLANVRALAEPIPYKGAQGLWNVPDGVVPQ